MYLSVTDMDKYYVTIWRYNCAPVEWEFPTYDECLKKLMSREVRNMKDVQLYQIEKQNANTPQNRNVVVLNNPVE